MSMNRKAVFRAQSTGSPSCVVSRSRWWPRSIRGTFYGIWSCSNNRGEGLQSVASGYLVSAPGRTWSGKR